MLGYIIVGLARLRLTLVSIALWMIMMFSLILGGYPGFFDTLPEILVFQGTALVWGLSGFILDDYYWNKI